MAIEIVIIKYSDHMQFVLSVFEKVVVYLDKFYDGDLPLRNENEIIKKFEEKFSQETLEEDLNNYISSKSKKSKKSDKSKGISEVDYEKIKMELLKPRVKEIISEYPFFTKAEQFFLRMLEVRINVKMQKSSSLLVMTLFYFDRSMPATHLKKESKGLKLIPPSSRGSILL